MSLRIATALTGLALAPCGESTPSASNPTSSPATTPATTEAACTVEVVMVPIRAQFDTAGNRATLAPQNGGLLCASGIARISVLIGPVNPPANGPQGALHLALLEDQGGQWVIANNTLCTIAGQPTKPIPAKLGQVCGLP